MKKFLARVKDKQVIFTAKHMENITHGEVEKILASAVDSKPLDAWDYLRVNGWVFWSTALVDDEPTKRWLIWAFPENELEVLEARIKGHDFYHEHGDGSNSYAAGHADKAWIESVGKKYPAQYKELWNKYCPDGMEMR